MLDHHKYNVFIFDCDGVILDSNKLKITAMHQTLEELGFNDEKVSQCINYFSSNFGKSRFHHVEKFLSDYLFVNEIERVGIERKVLELYSEKCKFLYLSAGITPGFKDFITSINGLKYVASGSEQTELREVFRLRGLDLLFDNVFGSPTSKEVIVQNILSKISDARCLMIGDAISDLEAAKNNLIDFVAYLPYSNVPQELKDLSDSCGYESINDWAELLTYKLLTK